MRLLSPEELKHRLPLSFSQEQKISQFRQTIQDIIVGKDSRIALVFGPCSIHDLSAALEYGRRFRTLAKEVANDCFCVMRVYVEKPRTTIGWKGLIYDPHLDGSFDLQTGLFWARELFLTLTDLDIPIATELLNPLLTPFLSDLISWAFIGARTSASQIHRELASSLEYPVGFKNSPDGNIDQAIQAMISARSPHLFPLIDAQGSLKLIESRGNPWCHVVLRGSTTEVNYDPRTIEETMKKLSNAGFKNRILIDCSHGNCQKNFSEQKNVFEKVLKRIVDSNDPVMGMMVESHLEEGSQFLSESPSALHYGVSVTDPCLGWADTESLIRFSSITLSSSKVIRRTQS